MMELEGKVHDVAIDFHHVPFCGDKNTPLIRGMKPKNGTSVSRGEKVRKYICRHCGKVFNDHTGTVYYDLRKEEHIIDLALKRLSIKIQ